MSRKTSKRKKISIGAILTGLASLVVVATYLESHLLSPMSPTGQTASTVSVTSVTSGQEDADLSIRVFPEYGWVMGPDGQIGVTLPKGKSVELKLQIKNVGRLDVEIRTAMMIYEFLPKVSTRRNQTISGGPQTILKPGQETDAYRFWFGINIERPAGTFGVELIFRIVATELMKETKVFGYF
jgi:hypothetical protein